MAEPEALRGHKLTKEERERLTETLKELALLPNRSGQIVLHCCDQKVLEVEAKIKF